jgi:hypothetical protein
MKTHVTLQVALTEADISQNLTISIFHLSRLPTIFLIVYHGCTLFSEPNTETSGVDLSLFSHIIRIKFASTVPRKIEMVRFWEMSASVRAVLYKVSPFRSVPPTNMATKGNSCF